MLRQTGAIKITQFNSAIEIYSRPTRSYGNQVAVLNSYVKNMAQNLVPNTFFRVTTCHRYLVQ